MVDSSHRGNAVMARNTTILMKADWFRHMAGERFRCTVCPHGCILRQGETGLCGVRIAGSNGIGNPHASHLTATRFDPIEKKPLFHFYPGKQILSLGASGCNLHCSWCQNYSISQVITPLQDVSGLIPTDKLVQLSAENPQSIGVAFTYNEPVIALEWVLESAKKFKMAEQKTVMVTNGFVNTNPLSALLEVVDAFNVDLKGFSEQFYARFTGGALKPVMNTLKQINGAQKHLEITFLAVTGLNTDLAAFDDLCRWIAGDLGPSIPLHISRYHAAWQCTQPTTPVLLMQELLHTAKKYLNFVYPGNIASGEAFSTCCQVCGHILIDRRLQKPAVTGLAGNRCSRCRALLYGQYSG